MNSSLDLSGRDPMRDPMRATIADLRGSLIREVSNIGLESGRDVLPFWFGESDEMTPEFVRQAAAESLSRGETFYSHNLGLAELRAALAGYTAAMHPKVSEQRIVVTSSGVTGLMLAAQLLVNPGDDAVAVVPVWPHIAAQPAILGANVRRVSLRPVNNAWSLDLQAVLDAVTPATRVLLLNMPNNPTGATLTRDEQQAILDHCRRTGTWIVADEVYERIFFGGSDGQAAPSFLDIATSTDRLIVAHSFSKSFVMTGWRLGWLVVPDGVAEPVGKLIELNNSCAPVFVQRGGLAALSRADTTVPALVRHLRACRDTLLGGLQAMPGIEVASPPGGMYAFFRVAGEDDSLALAKRLVLDHGLGLAPGAAFGPEGEGWLRWCFASRKPQRLHEGLDRLRSALRL